MKSEPCREPGGWGARTTFVLALAAAAVSLGNIWRFSFLVGTNGGGVFVLTYLACLFLVAVPLLIAEVVVGSHGRANPVDAILRTSRESRLGWGWVPLGGLACLTGLLVLTCLAVVAGWSLAYAYYMYSGVFSAASAALVGSEFDAHLRDPVRQLFWQTGFLAVAGSVVALGVRRGIGVLVWLVVPVLISGLLLLGRFAIEHGDIAATRAFLFSIKPVDFSPQSALLALGYALLTLGIGVGTGISYGAYAPQRIPVGRSVLAVAVFDSLVALLAGLIVFPLLFAGNLEPAAGPGLLFVSLPYAFGNILQGEVFGALFFILVALASLGSAVALMEPTVGFLVQRGRVARVYAVALVAVVVWSLGLLVTRSLAVQQPVGWYGSGSLLEFLDSMAAGLLLPLVSLLTAVYVGWRLRPEVLHPQLDREARLSVILWGVLLRYVIPPVIAGFLVAEFVSNWGKYWA